MKWDLNDKQAIAYWEDFRTQIFNTTTVDLNETEEQKAERIAHLEKKGNEELWFKYYFPKFYSKEPASFHIKSSVKFIYTPRIRQARQWARGLAKSTRRMMEVFYLQMVKKFPTNLLLCSRTYDNAERLLMPYMINLESNQRLINDYGQQERPGRWQKGEFVTRGNASFRAIGRGQNPSGARLDEMRITIIVYDDIDDQDALRNDEITEQDWEWMEKNVLPTIDISEDYRMVCDNNIKGDDSLAKRFAERATDISTVNLTDDNGNPTWKKNSLKDIQDIKDSMSYEAYEGEFGNNPMSQGKTFKEMKWGKCPKMSLLPFVLSYADPATSNKDKPTVRSKAKNSCKVIVLMGFKDMIFYVYKCFVEHTSNSNFIDGCYALKDYAAVHQAKLFYSFIENNTLQDPFYEQVFLPLIFQKARERKGDMLPITPDDREKPEKWSRVEANLEPLVRLGQFVLNIDEKDDPHMKRLEKQFTSAKPTSKEIGGPDACEGAVHIIKNKINVMAPGSIKVYKSQRNGKRY